MWKHAAEKDTFLKLLSFFIFFICQNILEVTLCLCVHKEMGSSVLKLFGFRN